MNKWHLYLVSFISFISRDIFSTSTTVYKLGSVGWAVGFNTWHTYTSGTFMYTYIHVHIHVHIYIHTYIHTYIHVHVVQVIQHMWVNFTKIDSKSTSYIGSDEQHAPRTHKHRRPCAAHAHDTGVRARTCLHGFFSVEHSYQPGTRPVHIEL